MATASDSALATASDLLKRNPLVRHGTRLPRVQISVWWSGNWGKACKRRGSDAGGLFVGALVGDLIGDFVGALVGDLVGDTGGQITLTISGTFDLRLFMSDCVALNRCHLSVASPVMISVAAARSTGEINQKVQAAR